MAEGRNAWQSHPKPPQGHHKATTRPPQGHILGIDSGVQSHPKATQRLHQGSTKAPPRPLSSQLIRPVCKSESQKPPVSAGPWPQWELLYCTGITNPSRPHFVPIPFANCLFLLPLSKVLTVREAHYVPFSCFPDL